MSENATIEAAVTPLTSENAREVFMNASKTFLNPYCGDWERQRLREKLLQILQNNDHRDIFAICVNEEDAIEAFAVAAAEDDVDLLQAFYEIGMNVDAKKQYGFSALRVACVRGSQESVRWLLDHSANTDIQDNFGGTPLMFAGSIGNIKILEMLVQKNANPDLQNKNGMTALMFASAYGYKEVVQLLLNYNADADLKNNDGTIALDLAKNEQMKELLGNHVTTSYLLK